MYDLKEIPTTAPADQDKKIIKEETENLLKELYELQNLLYAEGKHSLLVILQGMDASGKDGVIRKVFGRLNPQGVQVHSFKAPSEEELSYDFLWRVHRQVPAKGMIKVFNRSQYEDVLITRVHGWCDNDTAQRRFQAINNFEELLTVHNATVIKKFYLHISSEEQRARLDERINDPAKHWKHNKQDEEERKRWDEYRQAYKEAFENCSRIPWTIVPADQNWYKEYLITKQVTEALRELNMNYPGLKE